MPPRYAALCFVLYASSLGLFLAWPCASYLWRCASSLFAALCLVLSATSLSLFFCAFNAVGSFVGTMSAACLFFYAFNAAGSFVSTMSAACPVFYASIAPGGVGLVG